jgi:hypothetical protein
MTRAELARAARMIGQAACFWDWLKSPKPPIPEHHFPVQGGGVPDFEGLDTLFNERKPK